MVKQKDISNMNIYEKINSIKEDIKTIEFVLDCAQATQLGGKEYPSIGQYYRAITDKSIKYNLLFKWEVINVTDFKQDIFKPVNKMPQHMTTVECLATFINMDNPDEVVTYVTHASGSDSLDKGTSSASSMAFRNWFDKNFAPTYLTIDEFGGDIETSERTEQTSEPKVPTYIPQEKKEEIKQEVVSTPQHEESDEEDAKRIITKIMKVRELCGDANWGATTLQNIMSQSLTTADLLSIELKVDNKIETLGGDK